MTTATTVSLDLIKTNVFDAIHGTGGVESALSAKIDSLGANPTTADLMEVQRLMQQWSMLVDLQTTLTKTVSETMKGIVQKSG